MKRYLFFILLIISLGSGCGGGGTTAGDDAGSGDGSGTGGTGGSGNEADGSSGGGSSDDGGGDDTTDDGTGDDTGDDNDDGTPPEATPDTTPPTVSCLKETSGNCLAEAASISLNGSLVLSFSEAMDTSTLTNSKISATCNGATLSLTVAAATDSDEISDNEFSITAANWPNNTCTLTVTGGDTGVKDSAGNPLATNEAFTLSTICGLNQEFNSTDVLTNGCWTKSNDSFATTFDSDTTNDEKLTIVVDGAQDSESSPPKITQTIAGDFAMTVFFSDVDADTNAEKAFANISENENPVENKYELRFGKGVLTNKALEQLVLTDNSGTPTNLIDAGLVFETDDNDFFICFIRSSNTVTAQYKRDAADSFTSISSGSLTLSDSLATIEVGAFNDSGGDGFTTQADWIAITEDGNSCPTL